MPFFDLLSGLFYPLFAPLFGVKSLIIFNCLTVIIAIPSFYIAVSRLYNERIAVPAAILFALYPKYVVMTSSGLPEAASISFVAVTMYAFSAGRASNNPRHYLLAGVFAMLSMSMFVSSVAFAVILALFIYFTDVRDRLPMKSVLALIPTRKQLAFSLVPGVFGVSYLIFGPVSSLLSDVSANRRSLFVDPSGYTFVEKLFRFHAYSFFDFWWHTRGFDREQGILPLLISLKRFFGELFPIYLSGWIMITVGFTVIIVIGLVMAARRRQSLDVFLLCWVLVYISAYLYKNLGFIGGLQTRHISAVVPALCVAFGIGTVQLMRWVRNQEVRLLSSVQASKVISVLLIIGLSVLLVNGAVHGSIESHKQDEGITRPVMDVIEIIGDDSVGVVHSRDFHNIVLYSGNRVRPTILAGSPTQRSELRERHGQTVEVETISDNTLSTASVSYLYLRVKPKIIDRYPYTIDMNESSINTIRSKHEIVYHKHIKNGPFRTTAVNIYLLRINNNTTTAMNKTKR